MRPLGHIAIQEALDGKNVDWMEKVTDDEYRKVKQGATYQSSGF
jgi:hypothetical protein